MGLRDDLYQNIDKLYQKKLLRISSFREKSLQAIRDGKLPEDLSDREKDVIRWLIEDREMRLRRKRDIKELSADFKREREETQSEIKSLLDSFTREREVTRANWQALQAKVVRGKRQVDGIRQGLGYEAKAEEPPLASSEGKPWQIGEGV